MSVIDSYLERVTDDERDQGSLPMVEHLVACVLRRAHRKADALNKPDEARAVLHMAHAFADELATLNPRFDRLRFIETAVDYRPTS
jgi:hypothetical protein